MTATGHIEIEHDKSSATVQWISSCASCGARQPVMLWFGADRLEARKAAAHWGEVLKLPVLDPERVN
ncbi:hypothetical protein [Bradyrhizobium viridifuturi]|uniref:hypothetical protein n=1 Tax=Bradyrhizobium viridifuturi TaxID=1654716 RepID=UPI00067F2FEB|nr:hypothetical protein [Bradyrhizobium viridifuturi]